MALPKENEKDITTYVVSVVVPKNLTPRARSTPLSTMTSARKMEVTWVPPSWRLGTSS